MFCKTFVIPSVLIFSNCSVEGHLQPYYDDERAPLSDTEDEDGSEDEIVMVNRGGVVRGGDDSDSN